MKTMMTAEDLFEMPEDGYKYELVKGHLIRTSLTGAKQGEISVLFAQRLFNYVEKKTLGVVCAAATGFKIEQSPDTVRAPDASFVSRNRIPKEGVPEGYWPFPPDLAVEVVSPNDRYEEIKGKVKEYLASGIRMIWIADPKTRTVTVYRSLQNVRVLTESEMLSGEDVIPGFSCAVSELLG